MNHRGTEITEAIIGASIEVHRHLGPGLLESIYEAAVAYELNQLGLSVERQVPVRINYKGLTFEEGYRLDLLVEGEIVVELKCVEAVLPIHEAQMLSYLRLTGKLVGLLINFKVPQLRQGIRRFSL